MIFLVLCVWYSLRCEIRQIHADARAIIDTLRYEAKQSERIADIQARWLMQQDELSAKDMIFLDRLNKKLDRENEAQR
jgi:hypothetical protein